MALPSLDASAQMESVVLSPGQMQESIYIQRVEWGSQFLFSCFHDILRYKNIKLLVYHLLLGRDAFGGVMCDGVREKAGRVNAACLNRTKYYREPRKCRNRLGHGNK